MRKKQVYNISLDQDTFKRVKKNKLRIVLQLNNDDNQKINIKDKVTFIDEVSNKKCKKKVKKIYHYSDYKDAETKFSKDDIKKFGVLGIEVNGNRHIFMKVVLGILILLLLRIGYYFIDKSLEQAKSKDVAVEVSEIQKDKLDYVFVDINPSFVLTIKDDKVEDVACLNDDCMAIYNEIDIKGKDINTSINELYSLSSIKGYNTTKGIRIKTTSDVNIEKKDYITVEFISAADKDELLTNLKNNEDIKNNNNDGYYATLWESLKADGDYGDVYTCNMNNEELECYFTEKFILSFLVDEEKLVLDYLGWKQQVNRYYNTLDKFNVNHKMIDGLDYIIINDKEYNPVSGVVRNDVSILPPNVLLRNTINEGTKSFSTYNECIQIGSEEYIEFKDFNLLNPNNANVQTYIPQDVSDRCKDFPR